MEIDDDDQRPKGEMNGHVTGKRKSRQSLPNGKSYKEASSGSEDDTKPSVRFNLIIKVDSLANIGICRAKDVEYRMAKPRRLSIRILMTRHLCQPCKNLAPLTLY